MTAQVVGGADIARLPGGLHLEQLERPLAASQQQASVLGRELAWLERSAADRARGVDAKALAALELEVGADRGRQRAHDCARARPPAGAGRAGARPGRSCPRRSRPPRAARSAPALPPRARSSASTSSWAPSGARRADSVPAVSSGRIGSCRSERDRSRVEAGRDLEDRHAGDRRRPPSRPARSAPRRASAAAATDGRSASDAARAAAP